MTTELKVTEGDCYSLPTGLTKLQRDDRIFWKFEDRNHIIPIAKITGYTHNISLYDAVDGQFRDRLHLDSQTGSLTIRNFKITDSGLYKLQISSNNNGTSNKRFNVIVYTRLPIPDIISDPSQRSSSSERSSSSKCVLLCSVMNVTQVTLSWYKGNSLLSSISVSDLNTLSLPLEVEYQDTNTYSCVVNNPITNQTKHLNITDLCQPCSELTQLSTLSWFSGIVLILPVAAIIMIWLYKRRQARNVQSNREEIHTTNSLLKDLEEGSIANTADEMGADVNETPL